MKSSGHCCPAWRTDSEIKDSASAVYSPTLSCQGLLQFRKSENPLRWRTGLHTAGFRFSLKSEELGICLKQKFDISRNMLFLLSKVRQEDWHSSIELTRTVNSCELVRQLDKTQNVLLSLVYSLYTVYTQRHQSHLTSINKGKKHFFQKYLNIPLQAVKSSDCWCSSQSDVNVVMQPQSHITVLILVSKTWLPLENGPKTG